MTSIRLVISLCACPVPAKANILAADNHTLLKMPSPQFDHFNGVTGRTCRKCGVDEELGVPMKQCSRCKASRYCSRACQKADWKRHKKTCRQYVQATTLATTTLSSQGPPGEIPNTSAAAHAHVRADPRGPVVAPGLDVNLPTPFTRLYVKRWLHGRTEKDCFKLLFDAIRVRTWDDEGMAARSLLDMIKTSQEEASKLLVRRFLREAHRKQCLPGWWTTEKENECIEFGHSEENWKESERPVKMIQLFERYGTPSIAIQFRVFNEYVYGPVPGAGSSLSFLNYYMEMERAELMENFLQAIKDGDRPIPVPKSRDAGESRRGTTE